MSKERTSEDWVGIIDKGGRLLVTACVCVWSTCLRCACARVVSAQIICIDEPYRLRSIRLRLTKEVQSMFQFLFIKRFNRRLQNTNSRLPSKNPPSMSTQSNPQKSRRSRPSERKSAFCMEALTTSCGDRLFLRKRSTREKLPTYIQLPC